MLAFSQDGYLWIEQIALYSLNFLIFNLVICSLFLMIGLIWIEKIIFINTFLVSALVVIILLDVVVIIYDLDPQDQFKYLKVFNTFLLKSF